MSGCAGGLFGVFATDTNLSDSYTSVREDSDIAFFYTPNATGLSAAVKNIGNTFMTGLSVTVTCGMVRGSDASYYSIGNLKTYYNKKLSIPLDIEKCLSITVGYSYIPQADGVFFNNSNINMVPQAPVNPVEGMFILKEPSSSGLLD